MVQVWSGPIFKFLWKRRYEKYRQKIHKNYEKIAKITRDKNLDFPSTSISLWTLRQCCLKLSNLWNIIPQIGHSLVFSLKWMDFIWLRKLFLLLNLVKQILHSIDLSEWTAWWYFKFCLVVKPLPQKLQVNFLSPECLSKWYFSWVTNLPQIRHNSFLIMACFWPKFGKTRYENCFEFAWGFCYYWFCYKSPQTYTYTRKLWILPTQIYIFMYTF